MKKTISILLAICFCCVMCASVSAENTQIIAAVEPSYAITVPAELHIDFEDITDWALLIETADDDFRIHAEERVDVSVSTANGKFALSNGTDEIPYIVKSPGVTGQGVVAASFTEKGQSKTIHINVPDWSGAKTAGSYSQPLIFTLTYSYVAPL